MRFKISLTTKEISLEDEFVKEEAYKSLMGSWQTHVSKININTKCAFITKIILCHFVIF